MANQQPSRDEIKSALTKIGVRVSDEELGKLENGEHINLTESNVSDAASSAPGKCSGIKIVQINQNCALYWEVLRGLYVCCEWAT